MDPYLTHRFFGARMKQISHGRDLKGGHLTKLENRSVVNFQKHNATSDLTTTYFPALAGLALGTPSVNFVEIFLQLH